MICPSENAEMREVKVESHYGQTELLDQCPVCGGIWFDYLELYAAKQGQGEKIELLNDDALRTNSLIEKSGLLCPRDAARLVHFDDPSFLKNIIIARCPVCSGFWLN